MCYKELNKGARVLTTKSISMATIGHHKEKYVKDDITTSLNGRIGGSKSKPAHVRKRTCV